MSFVLYIYTVSLKCLIYIFFIMKVVYVVYVVHNKSLHIKCWNNIIINIMRNMKPQVTKLQFMAAYNWRKSMKTCWNFSKQLCSYYYQNVWVNMLGKICCYDKCIAVLIRPMLWPLLMCQYVWGKFVVMVATLYMDCCLVFVSLNVISAWQWHWHKCLAV